MDLAIWKPIITEKQQDPLIDQGWNTAGTVVHGISINATIPIQVIRSDPNNNWFNRAIRVTPRQEPAILERGRRTHFQSMLQSPLSHLASCVKSDNISDTNCAFLIKNMISGEFPRGYRICTKNWKST